MRHLAARHVFQQSNVQEFFFLSLFCFLISLHIVRSVQSHSHKTGRSSFHVATSVRGPAAVRTVSNLVTVCRCVRMPLPRWGVCVTTAYQTSSHDVDFMFFFSFLADFFAISVAVK